MLLGVAGWVLGVVGCVVPGLPQIQVQVCRAGLGGAEQFYVREVSVTFFL